MDRSSAVAMAVAGLLLLPGARPDRACAKDGAPETPAEAMAQARPLLDDAIKAAPERDNDCKAFKVNAERLRSALSLLKSQSKDGFKSPEFQALWNETGSLFRYHKVEPFPEYQLEEKTMSVHPIRFKVPVGRGWTYRSLQAGKDEQQWGEVKRTLPNKRVVRHIKIWVYNWNTVYSGVGGENAKGLAEGAMGGDRMGMEKVTFRSDRIVTARMGKGFPKTSYYEIVGEDKELGPVRRRNYYVKGSSTTFNFEVIEMRKTAPEDDPWTVWQTSGPDPELDAVLESFEDTGGKKK